MCVLHSHVITNSNQHTSYQVPCKTMSELLLAASLLYALQISVSLSLLIQRSVTLWNKLVFFYIGWFHTLHAGILMWSSLSWTPWGFWSGQDKEPEEVEVKKQTKAGGGQRSGLSVKYYQRNRPEEKSPIAGETVDMDKGKLKPPGRAKRASGNKRQGDGAELDDEWQIVHEEELQVITTCKCKGRNNSILASSPGHSQSLSLSHGENQEKAWDHCYVMDRKWWTRLVQTESTLRTNRVHHFWSVT